MSGSRMKLPWHAIRFLGKGLGAFLLLYLLVLGTHKFWLPLFAEILIVKTPLKKCDLIVVSTGSYARFLHAVELMKKGYGGKLLLLGDERLKSNTGETPLDVAINALLSAGIPQESFLHKNSTSTQDDARGAKSVMAELGLESAIIVSDKYNMRRVSLIFDRVFDGTAFDLSYAYNKQDELASPDRWWTSYGTFIYVLKEWIKLPIDFYLLFKAGNANEI